MEKEKKPFVSPEVEVVLLGEQDVIATSGGADSNYIDNEDDTSIDPVK